MVVFEYEKPTSTGDSKNNMFASATSHISLIIVSINYNNNNPFCRDKYWSTSCGSPKQNFYYILA
jgi:hypothetical protein